MNFLQETIKSIRKHSPPERIREKRILFPSRLYSSRLNCPFPRANILINLSDTLCVLLVRLSRSASSHRVCHKDLCREDSPKEVVEYRIGSWRENTVREVMNQLEIGKFDNETYILVFPTAIVESRKAF